MNLKKTIILIIILAILLGVAYSLKKKNKKGVTELVMFPDFTEEKVKSIRINGQINKLNIIKEEDKWLIPEQDNLYADNEQVSQALQTIKELKHDNIISTNPDKQELFQVDSNNGLEIDIKGEDDKSMAHFFIGKNGPDFMSTYIRKADANEVILYRGFHLRSRFDKGPEAWLDKTITKLDENDIKEVMIQQAGKQAYSLTHENEKWMLQTPEVSPVKDEEVKATVSLLASLRSLKVEHIKEGESLEKFGLNNPYITVNISLFDGTAKTLLISKSEEKKDQYYAHLSDKENLIFTVAKYIIDRLDKSWESLKAEEAVPKEAAETDTNQLGINIPPDQGH